jgi:hypothetical protein
MEIHEGLGFHEIIIETIDEFIELIRPDKRNINKYLESANGKFIYRGQADSNWELEPSLFRHSPSDQILSKTFDGLCFMHWVRLKAFINGCDLNSSNIPFDSKTLRDSHFNEFDSTVVFNTNAWPHAELYELIAFAQHYGVWTEFLDWTKNPLVACYFAASQIIAQPSFDGMLSVWVFDTEKKNSLNNFKEKNFEIIEVPKSANQNISSQQGCFTLVRQNLVRGTTLTFGKHSKRINQLKLLNELLAEKRVRALLKISLPKKFAPELLQYCSAYSINAATIFRGIEGAAVYAKESFDIESYRKKVTQLD